MVDPIEAAALAIDAALNYEVERDALACDLTREEQRKVVTAAYAVLAPILREEGARAMQEAAADAVAETVEAEFKGFWAPEDIVDDVPPIIRALNPAEIVKGIGQ